MSIGDEKHILLTTFSDGQTTRESVERIVSVSDSRLGFWVPDASVLEHRFDASDTVTVQACARGGKPDRTQPVLEGRAEVVTEGPLFDEVKHAVADKYGFEVTVESTVDKVKEVFGHKTPEAVVLIDVVG